MVEKVVGWRFLFKLSFPPVQKNAWESCDSDGHLELNKPVAFPPKFRLGVSVVGKPRSVDPRTQG